MCPICEQVLQGKLTRHLSRRHKDNDQVSRILSQPHSTHRREFAKLRNVGIEIQNMQQIDKRQMERIKVAKSEGEMVHCSNCKGAYSKTFFYRHKKKCTKAQPILPDALKVNASTDFKAILSSHHRKLGETIRTDDTIQLIGEHLWQKKKTKPDKFDETRTSVMTSMRILANLYESFKKEKPDATNSKEMFDVDNWSYLKEAILKSTTKDKDSEVPHDIPIKYGLKKDIYYNLRNGSKAIAGKALTIHGSKGRDLRTEQQEFQELLEHQQSVIFADVKYYVNKTRQETLRLPKRTPPTEPIERLRDFQIEDIQQLCNSAMDEGNYVALRNHVCSRLTLFNARRGGEPSRMSTQQWVTRDKWIDQEKLKNLTAEEKKMFQEMDITFTSGKGNHLVDIIIPNECIPAMNILADNEKRSQAGVSKTNTYLFPSTRGSERHVCGWSATDDSLKRAGIECPSINATNQRARLSTFYANRDVPPEHRDTFYKHMGHSEAVNIGTYQRPLPVLAMTRVGAFLKEVDSNKSKPITYLYLYVLKVRSFQPPLVVFPGESCIFS